MICTGTASLSIDAHADTYLARLGEVVGLRAQSYFLTCGHVLKLHFLFCMHARTHSSLCAPVLGHGKVTSKRQKQGSTQQPSAQQIQASTNMVDAYPVNAVQQSEAAARSPAATAISPRAAATSLVVSGQPLLSPEAQAVIPRAAGESPTTARHNMLSPMASPLGPGAVTRGPRATRRKMSSQEAGAMSPRAGAHSPEAAAAGPDTAAPQALALVTSPHDAASMPAAKGISAGAMLQVPEPDGSSPKAVAPNALAIVPMHESNATEEYEGCTDSDVLEMLPNLLIETPTHRVCKSNVAHADVRVSYLAVSVSTLHKLQDPPCCFQAYHCKHAMCTAALSKQFYSFGIRP